LKAVHHILVSSAETRRAFNSSFNLNRPTLTVAGGLDKVSESFGLLGFHLHILDILDTLCERRLTLLGLHAELVFCIQSIPQKCLPDEIRVSSAVWVDLAISAAAGTVIAQLSPQVTGIG
jgi:hypothetical protein